MKLISLDLQFGNGDAKLNKLYHLNHNLSNLQFMKNHPLPTMPNIQPPQPANRQ